MTDIDTTSRTPGFDRFPARQRIAVAVLLTANFTLAVDFSILNVALPHIGRDLGFATGTLQWIVTSFAVCAAGFTLFFGRVADLFGRKRIFLLGIALLGTASLVGGLAGDPTILIIARIGQGLATAMVTPAALSLMTTMLPEGPRRAKILGLNGALMAAGFTAGAVLGGVLTGTASWRWAFFINVVVTGVVMLIAPAVLREPGTAGRAALDVPGAVTITSALIALVFGIDTAGHSGWTHPGAWVPILVAIAMFATFWTIESRVNRPLVSLSLLRRRTVGMANLAGLLAFATETSLVFVLTLYLQEILGFSALAAGLILGVLGIGTVLGGLLAPRIIGRTGSATAMVIGFVVQAVATFPLAFVSDDRGWLPILLVVTFVGGIANLIAIVGYVVTATNGVSDDQQGLATGVVTMSQQVGITLGTPVMSAVLTAVASASLLPGLRVAISVNATAALATGLVMAILLRNRHENATKTTVHGRNSTNR